MTKEEKSFLKMRKTIAKLLLFASIFFIIIVLIFALWCSSDDPPAMFGDYKREIKNLSSEETKRILDIYGIILDSDSKLMSIKSRMPNSQDHTYTRYIISIKVENIDEFIKNNKAVHWANGNAVYSKNGVTIGGGSSFFLEYKNGMANITFSLNDESVYETYWSVAKTFYAVFYAHNPDYNGKSAFEDGYYVGEDFYSFSKSLT